MHENAIGTLKSTGVSALREPRRVSHELELLAGRLSADLEEANRRLRIEVARRTRAEDALRESERRFNALKVAEDALRQSEERFRLLVEGVKDYAIYMLDPGGYILSWNPGAERIKGYRSEEIVGKHFSAFYPPEDIRSGKPASDLAAASEGRFEDEGWRIRKNGTRFWANVVIRAMHDSEGKLRGFSKITRDITERVRAEESLRRLSGRLLSVQDEERRRLARELHDSTAQTLSALSLNLALVKSQADLSNTPRAVKALSESLELAAQAGSELRTISYLLHPPTLDEQGLCDALRWYVDGFTQRTKINVDLEVSLPELDRLSRDLETALFRIVQECLTNIYRHSGSPTAEVRLTRNTTGISLHVRDHGKGIPEVIPGGNDGAPVKLGVGIHGMRERVSQLGGHMKITCGHPGTVVRVSLPLASVVAPTEQLLEHCHETMSS